MKKLKLTAACGCNMGKIRKNNEDNFYFNQVTLPEENLGMDQILYAKYNLSESAEIFGVFDGMGGEADGQIASYLSASLLKEKRKFLISSPAKINKNYEDLIQKMNEIVYLDAEKRFNRMGCTASMLMFADKKVYLCNVGDSPIFRLRGNVMTQISQDHTDAEMLKQQGITNRKPHLTQCIGISPEEMQIQPYLYEEKICADDRYLICSDGLTDMVKKEEIERTLQEVTDLEECVECLIQKALDGGGRDNITVVVLQIEDGDASDTGKKRESNQKSVHQVNNASKGVNQQISEEFKDALRKNDFLDDEEKKEIVKQQQKTSKVSTPVKSKKSKSWTGIIVIMAVLLGVGILAKPVLKKVFKEEVKEPSVLQEDINIDDISGDEFEGTLKEESQGIIEEIPTEPAEGDDEPNEKSDISEEKEIQIDLNGDGTEDLIKINISNDEAGSSLITLNFDMNGVQSSYLVDCSYELSNDYVLVSSGQLDEEHYALVIQSVDAASGYGSTQYDVLSVLKQEEQWIVKPELTILDKVWEAEEYYTDYLQFGAIQAVPEDEAFSYIDEIEKNSIRVRQARTLEEEQSDNEVFLYWDGSDWQIYGIKALNLCRELHDTDAWTKENAEVFHETYDGNGLETVPLVSEPKEKEE